MSLLSSTSALGSSLTSALTQVGRKKAPTRDEIFADQQARDAEKEVASETAKADFLSYARMSPAERIRADFLKDKGLTEETLAQLPREERMKIEEEIKQLIKKKLGLDESKGAGQIVDATV